ncbi:MAG TPA: PilW family protein [Rhodanobacteraceae bacterium]|nr:PilW family protein [Rhodanobacteraceae bacterium]
MIANRKIHRPVAAGVSLIEMMVALVIAGLLAIGLLQIFAASSATSRMQEGLSRVQESGRFAVQYLDRQLRMVGYMGCGSDTERLTQASAVNHLAQFDAAVPGGNVVPGGPQFRFQRPIEAFTVGTDTLPAGVDALGATDGTQILVLRMIGDESVPVIQVTRTAGNVNNLEITVASATAPVFAGTDGGEVLYALESCRSADVFAATQTGTVLTALGATAPNVYLDPGVTDCNAAGNCPWDFRISNAFLNASSAGGGGLELNAAIHRAEYLAIFVKDNAEGIPSLYVHRFERDSHDLAPTPEELTEGIENLQLRFGIDTGGDGQVDEYRSTTEVIAGLTDDVALDAAWRKVVSVRVGMLIQSAQRAGVGGQVSGSPRTYTVLGTTITPPDDGAMRQVYETTIALRNRIFNS